MDKHYSGACTAFYVCGNAMKCTHIEEKIACSKLWATAVHYLKMFRSVGREC